MASATETSAPQETIPGLELTDDVIQAEREIIAEIVVDEALKGDYGPQWHFAARPLTYKLETKTGCVHEYVPLDKRGPRTKFGIVVGSLMMVMGADRPKSIGSGLLVGRQVVLLEKDFTFGKDRETGEPIVRQFILFKRLLTPEDQAAVEAYGGTVSRMPTSSFTDEQVAELLGVIVGQSEAMVSATAARSKTLSPELKASILSGVAVPALLASEKIVLGADGKYAALPF